jgi:hypothetical protein
MVEIKLYKYVCNNPGFSQFYPRDSMIGTPWREFKRERTNNLTINRKFVEPQAELDLFYFTYKYKLCDITDPYVNLTDGMFVSERCLDIFKKQLNLPPVKVYPIYYKKKDKIVSDYYFVYFYFGLSDSIVFDKSYFMISPSFGSLGIEERAIEKKVQFKDIKQFDFELRKLIVDEKNLGIYYQNIVFEKDTISKYDIFPIHLLNDSELYLSEKFMEIYQKEVLTGLDSNIRTFDKFFEEE